MTTASSRRFDNMEPAEKLPGLPNVLEASGREMTGTVFVPLLAKSEEARPKKYKYCIGTNAHKLGCVGVYLENVNC